MKKINKFLSVSMLAISSAAAIGCATSNSQLARKINNGVNEFVSSINKLDYVDAKKENSSLGKIVSAANEIKYISPTKTTSIENTITSPENRTDNFKLYVLSESPYVTFTSDQDDNSFYMSFQISTGKIETTSNKINEKINKLILKRAILMVYVNEIYNGNVNLTEENRTAINAYVNTIKENASYLKGNRGMVKNQLGLANDLLENKTNDNLVNYYLIKSNEALEIRSNKIDTTISAIDSIISILESNLSPNSCYYQNNLSGAYENMISNLSNTSTDENTKLAKNIAESIDFLPSINNTQSGNDTELQKDSNEQRSIPGNQNTINNTPITNQNESKNLRLNNPSNTSYDQNYNNQKTQNTQEITANPSVLTDNSNNIHNSMTPSERARMRRRMAQNRRAYDNVARNQSTNQENLTPQTAIPNTPNNLVENIPDNKNKTQATSAQNEHGRATRVPYKVESTSFVE